MNFFFIFLKRESDASRMNLGVILLGIYTYIYYGNSMQGKVQHVDRVDCFEIDLFSFLPFLPFPFDLQKISIIIFLPFPPPFPGGKIIHEEQKRVLIYLQIEQEHCFERETSQSVKIIKPIRMDQPESKGNYRSNHRTNKSRSTVMASGILSITYFLSVSETAFSD